MGLRERGKVTDSPGDHVAIAMQVAVATGSGTEHLCDVAGDRWLLGEDGHYFGLNCRVAQITSLV